MPNLHQAQAADATAPSAPGDSRNSRLRRWLRSHPTLITVTGSLVVGGALVVGLWGKRADFAVALGLAPVWILAAAILLHVVWLVARSEAWHVCVGAAGGSVSRRGSIGRRASVISATPSMVSSGWP